jgi:hypothetical protein
VIARRGKQTVKGKLQATRIEQSRVEKKDKIDGWKARKCTGRTIFSHLIIFL